MLLNDQGGGVMGFESGDASPTLRAESHGHEPAILFNDGTENDMDYMDFRPDRERGELRPGAVGGGVRHPRHDGEARCNPSKR